MSFRLLEITRPIARKEHTCEWCGEKINKGEKYVRVKGIYDDNFQDTCMHLECDKACIKFFNDNVSEDTYDPYIFKRGTTEQR